MGVTSGWAVTHARRQIVGLAADDLGWSEFAEALLEIYTSLIPVEGIVLSTIDPHSGLFTSLTRSGIDDVHDELFLDIEFTHPDPITLTTLAQTRDGVGILADHHGGDPESNPRFRELLRPHYDLEHEMRGVVRIDGQMWGAATLYRAPESPAFTREEADTLASLEGVVAHGIRSCLLADAGQSWFDLGRGPAVIILDRSGHIEQCTATGHTRLAALGWDGHGHLPTPIRATATAARNDTPAFAHTRLASGEWVIVRAAPLATPDAEPRIALSVEPSPIDIRPAPTDRDNAALVLTLTDRQHDVLALVAQGHTNGRIAFELGIAEGTVRKHMETILQSLGACNRAEAAAMWSAHCATGRG